MTAEALLEAIVATAELTGTELSVPAARLMLADLKAFPHDQVVAALHRCRVELRGRLTTAEVIARIDDGRPGPEEAWNMIPRDENASVVWSQEMREAAGACNLLMADGDMIGARMAFLERYRKAVLDARWRAVPPRWEFSPGRDVAGRDAALIDAAQRGRLTWDQALAQIPAERVDANLLAKAHAAALRRLS